MPVPGLRGQPVYGERMVSPVKDITGLQRVERLMSEAERGQGSCPLPPSRFYCLLDDQPDHLLPAPYLRSQDAALKPDLKLFVNPTCRFTGSGELPLEQFDVPEQFALPSEMVWTNDPATRSWRPFWLGRNLASLLAGVQPGDPAPPGLPANARHALILAEVLVAKDYEFRRLEQWSAALALCAPQFQQNGYAPISGLIHPLHIAAMRRYYRYLIRNRQLTLGDVQCDRRYLVQDDGVGRFFHHQITAAMAQIAGQPLRPSYAFLASYQSGSRLPRHIDREQCEFSISLCLDYSPEPHAATPWPLQLQTAVGHVSVFQALGDALVYRGCELPHYRDALPEGHTSTSIFFHYVNMDFTGSPD
jgi:hypothetical protein